MATMYGIIPVVLNCLCCPVRHQVQAFSQGQFLPRGAGSSGRLGCRNKAAAEWAHQGGGWHALFSPGWSI